MTGTERAWAKRYEIEDVVRFSRGSKLIGIEAGSYAKVVTVNAADNLVGIKLIHTFAGHSEVLPLES
jgi:hypothetical protein